MKNEVKKGAKSDQKPIKIEVWKMDGFRIDFSELQVDFFRFLGVGVSAYLPSVRKVTCRKTNKKGKGRKKKEKEGRNAMQDKGDCMNEA